MENFVFLSAHSPLQMCYFARALVNSGRFRVLAICDTDYDAIPEDLRSALGEHCFFRVGNLWNYDECYSAVAWFAHKHGRPHYIESLNECWMPTEARLREDFNVRSGWSPAALADLRKKSFMKALFEKAGVAVGRWCIPKSLEELRAFEASLGDRRSFVDIFVKPDTGVNAHGARRIASDADIARFWEDARSDIEAGAFIAEEFLVGPVITYDGLVADDGKIIFASSLEYEATPFDVMSGGVPSSSKRFSFWVHPTPLKDVAVAGPSVVRAFGLRRRFFHAEFVRQSGTGKLFALEINLRPPGSPTSDLWNFSSDCDVYALYARVLSGQPVDPVPPGRHICVYVGRRPQNVRYARSVSDVAARFGNKLVAVYHPTPAFAELIGSEAFVVRVASIGEVNPVITAISEEWREPVKPVRLKGPVPPVSQAQSQQQIQQPKQSQQDPSKVQVQVQAPALRTAQAKPVKVAP